MAPPAPGRAVSTDAPYRVRQYTSRHVCRRLARRARAQHKPGWAGRGAGALRVAVRLRAALTRQRQSICGGHVPQAEPQVHHSTRRVTQRGTAASTRGSSRHTKVQHGAPAPMHHTGHLPPVQNGSPGSRRSVLPQSYDGQGPVAAGAPNPRKKRSICPSREGGSEAQLLSEVWPRQQRAGPPGTPRLDQSATPGSVPAAWSVECARGPRHSLLLACSTEPQ